MVVPFGLVAFGVLLAYSGLHNKTILETLKGLPGSAASIWSSTAIYNAATASGDSGSSGKDGGMQKQPKGKRGEISVAPGANRPGVPIKPIVLDFDRRLAGFLGRRLTIGTGSNHSRTTTSGNVSDHWDGYATDIPASGAELTKMGQAALIIAGMSPSQARKQHGGLFNVGGWQIIFNTNEGGNHFNHLHVGKSH